MLEREAIEVIGVVRRKYVRDRNNGLRLVIVRALKRERAWLKCEICSPKQFVLSRAIHLVTV